MTAYITIRGARLHNLKNVTLTIPKNQFVVLTGLFVLAAAASGGVAAWDGREGPESLVNRADDALYQAKREGRDRVVSAA